jgi:hypothetical protein
MSVSDLKLAGANRRSCDIIELIFLRHYNLNVGAPVKLAGSGE